MLARKTKRSITPTYIHGAYSAWPTQKKRPKLFGKKTTCIFGEPISYEEITATCQDDQEIADLIHKKVSELRDNYVTNP